MMTYDFGEEVGEDRVAEEEAHEDEGEEEEDGDVYCGEARRGGRGVLS